MAKKHKVFVIAVLGIAPLFLGLLSASATEISRDGAAPSVNMFWKALNSIEENTWIQREVVVEKSAPNTYFSIIGNWTPPFYLGIQELGKDSKGNPIKVALFSAWDVYNDNNCTNCSGNNTPGYGIVKVTTLGPGVRGGRFGGEGTGAQAFIDNFNWLPGDHVQAAVHLAQKPSGTEISSAIRINEGPWRFFAAYLYPKTFTHLEPGYSFIEDFGKTPELERSARFENSWLESEYGDKLNPVSEVQVQPNPSNLNVNFHRVESREYGAWVKSGGSSDFSTKREYIFPVKFDKQLRMDEELKKILISGASESFEKYLEEKLAFEAIEAEKKLAAAKILKLQTKYSTCKNLNLNFKGGIAKSASSRNKGAKTKFRPEISAPGYQVNRSLDLDKDGIACER